MQFAALIEYLVTGIVSSVWIVAILNEFIPIPTEIVKDYKEIIVVIYFPVAYILGIYTDVVSSYFIRRVKELHDLLIKYRYIEILSDVFLRAFVFVAGTPKRDPYKNASIILSRSPSDMVKTMDAFVSRDRIARGMALNSIISAFVFLWVLPCEISNKAFIICLVFFLISIFIWRRLRRLSSTFKRVAIKTLNESEIA